MVVRPESIKIDDNDRSLIRLWMGNSGMATRKEVTQIIDRMWGTFMLDVRSHGEYMRKQEAEKGGE